MCDERQMHCLLEQSGDAVVMPLLQHGPILLSANADPFSDAADAYVEPEAKGEAGEESSELLTVPSSFVRDLGDLQESGRAEEWMDYFPLPPPDPSLTGAVAQPNLDWESSLNTADSFFDVDWTSTEIKRRRSAPAVQDSSKSYLPAASDALVPDWNQDLNDSRGKINESTRGRSLPEHDHPRHLRRQMKAKHGGNRKAGLRRDCSYPVSFPTSAMYHGSTLGPHGGALFHQGENYGAGKDGLHQLNAERRAASKKVVYRIRSNALTSKRPPSMIGLEMPPPAKAKTDPKTSSSNALSEEYMPMSSSPEISSEQDRANANAKPSISSGGADISGANPNVGKSGPEQIAVDASKLSQFLGQIQTIQEKVNRLQIERKASQNRMETIEASAMKMSCLLEDLEHLKADGAPIADREQRLERGSADLHSLLQAIRKASDNKSTALQEDE